MQLLRWASRANPHRIRNPAVLHATSDVRLRAEWGGCDIRREQSSPGAWSPPLEACRCLPEKSWWQGFARLRAATCRNFRGGSSLAGKHRLRVESRDFVDRA